MIIFAVVKFQLTMEIESLYARFRAQKSVTTDSRNCPPGSIFFALRGATFDGNRFAAKALEAGCSCAVVDDPAVAVDDRYVLVDDTLLALQALARRHRREWGRTVVGITGTNGKTTTKELTAACLSRRFKVLATEGNLNNAIGVPLTLLRLDDTHEIAVVEMGASHPGDIAELVAIAEPDYALITNVGKAHLQGFGSFEGVVGTKCELYDFVKAHGGKIFLHHEDEVLAPRAAGAVAAEYGTTPGLWVSGRLVGCSPFLSLAFTCQDTTCEVDTRLIGSYNLPNTLAAAAVAAYFGVAPDEIAAALAAYEPQNRRSQMIKTARNTLIVDAYNANPSSMAVALDNFLSAELPHKTLILGDMGELGADSEAEHRRIVERLRGNPDIETIFVGEEFSRIAGDAVTFADTEALLSALQAKPLSGRTVLIKGSRFMKLERCIDYL